MNKLLKKGLLLVALSTGIQSNATVIPGMANHDEYETTMLAFLNVRQGNKIQVKDAQGTILYKEKIKNVNEFEHRFNLCFLPDGEYFIELDRKSEVVIMPVDIVNNLLAFKTKSAYVVPAKSNRKVKNAEKPVELEKGIPRRISSFKGENYLEYLNK